MYAVIRRYKFDVSKSAEIKPELDEFIPLIRELPGFVGYYWLHTGKGEFATFSVFEDRARAEESSRLAADYIRKHPGLVLGKPEIMEGEVDAYTLREAHANV